MVPLFLETPKCQSSLALRNSISRQHAHLFGTHNLFSSDKNPGDEFSGYQADQIAERVTSGEISEDRDICITGEWWGWSWHHQLGGKINVLDFLFWMIFFSKCLLMWDLKLLWIHVLLIEGSTNSKVFHTKVQVFLVPKGLLFLPLWFGDFSASVLS